MYNIATYYHIQFISKKNEIVEGRIELGTQNGGKFKG